MLCIKDENYNGTEPYAGACINITVKANYTRMENSAHIVYTTECCTAGDALPRVHVD